MPNSYKTRTIHDFTGRELDENAKDAAYNLSLDTINSLKETDNSTQRLNLFLHINKVYNENNLNIDRPVDEWTNEEVLEKIRHARTEAGLGRVGFFEAGDRVRNFRARKALSDSLTRELAKIGAARTNSIIDACIGAAATNGRTIQKKNNNLSKIAINWIPYLMRLKREKPNQFWADLPSLEPARVFKNLNEETPDSLINMMDMLQMIEDTDMEEFLYTDNESFAASFATKYEKLKALASGSEIIEYVKSKNNTVFKTKRALLNGNEDSNKVTIAKSRLAKEMLKDYENRMRLITSPYYALFAGKDFEKLNENRISRMKKGAGHEALDTYLDEVIAYKRGKANSYKGVDVTERLNTYILGVQPAPAPVVRLKSDITFEQINRLIQKMYADTRKATAYTEARNVFGAYLNATNEDEKKALLINTVVAANNYLQARRPSSYGYRKERCEELINLYGKYNGELRAERMEVHAREAALQAEQERQRAFRAARENELRNKALDREEKAGNWRRAKEAEEERRKAEEKARREEEERARLEAEREAVRLRAEREAELKNIAEQAEKKAENWRKGKEAEERRLAEINRAKRIFIETLNQTISKYEELGKLGKTGKDSEEARKTVKDFLDKYVFKEGPKEDVSLVPTAMLVNVLKAHAVDTDKPDYAELVKADIKKQGWKNSPVYENYKKPIKEVLSKKAEAITEQDRLTAYEYSVHMLHYGAGVEKLTFESARGMNLKKLVTVAVHHANLAEGSVEKNLDDAVGILSVATGVEADLIKYLPAKDIDKYAKNSVKYMMDPKKLEKNHDECLKKARIIKKKHDLFSGAISAYEDLGKDGKTAKDSAEARKNVLDFLDNYIFKASKKLDEDNTDEQLEIIPTAMLVSALKNHAKDIDKADFAKLVKADISKQLWDHSEGYEGFKNPIEDILKKKPEEMTEQERLNVREFSAHVLYYATELSEDTSIDTFKDMDLTKLGTLAWDVIRLDEGLPNSEKKETFDTISDEMRDLHIDAAAAILSSFSGVDAADYKYLSIEDISKYAYGALEHMPEPEEQKKVLDECTKKATAIKERYNSLTKAVESLDRKKIIDSIKSVTGQDQSDLSDIPTADLIELVDRMIINVRNEDDLLRVCSEYKRVLTDRPAEYYREMFIDLDAVGREEELPQNLLLTKREHGIAYVTRVLSPSKISENAFAGVDDDTLYKLVTNISIIDYLKSTANSKALEKNKNLKKDQIKIRDVLKTLSDAEFETIGMDVRDYDRAVTALDELEVNQEIKDGIKNILKPEVERKKVAFFGDVTDVDIDYAVETSNPIGNVQVIKPTGTKVKKNQNNQNIINENPNKIIEEQEKEEWSYDSQKLLNLIGDIYYAVAKKPIDTSVIYKSVIDGSDIIGKFINAADKKAQDDLYKELVKGLSDTERSLVEGAKPVIDDIVSFYKDILSKKPKYKPGSRVSLAKIERAIEDNKLKIDLSKRANGLNSVAQKAEQEFIRLMNEATADPFDQIGGMGIPDIFNLDGNKTSDKDTLLFAHNNLRYNKEYGQGKFITTLMNDYYIKSSLVDRRFMLSHIIKDFKKNDDNDNEIKKGGDYFASSLKGAGPVMQKMMQGVPEYMIIPELRGAINVVKSDLRPIDKKHVDDVLETIKKNSGESIDYIRIKNNLGAASVAETFLCVVSGKDFENKEVVLKILRPDAKDRMNRELSIIRESARSADEPNNDMKEVGPIEAGFVAQLSEIEKEFNLQNEAQNCQTGVSKYANKNKQVKTVEILNVPMAENYLLMSKAKGITLDRHIKETRETAVNALKVFEVKEGKTQKNQTTYKITLDNIDNFYGVYRTLKKKMDLSLQYGSHVSKVAEVWTGQALFGSAWNALSDDNFHHGDLHSGNIMVNEDYATILDYGNATNLHHKKVTNILEMMMSVVLKRPDLYVDAFKRLLNRAIKEDKKRDEKERIGYEPLTPEQEKEYKERLKNIFNTGTQENAGLHIMLSLSTAQSLGIKLPMELQNFSQCQQRLENSMEEIKQAAMESRKAIDKLERIPLDESIMKSCDPLVVFQRHMLSKNKKGKYIFKDSHAAAEYLRKGVHYIIKQEFNDELFPLKEEIEKGVDVSKKADEIIKKHYLPYNRLTKTEVGRKKPVTLNTFPKKAEEWRQIFKRVKEGYEKTGEPPVEMEFPMMTMFFTEGVQDGGIINHCANKDKIVDLAGKAFRIPFDELAFEKLMTICEVDICYIADNVKNMNLFLTAPNKFKGPELEEFDNAINAAKFKESPFVYNFVDRIRNVSNLKTFETEMERMFDEHPKFKEKYDDYKKTLIAYEKLTLENSREEFISLRKKLIRSEDSLVVDYCDIAEKYFDKIADRAEGAYDMESIKNSPMVPEYIEVIYDVVMKDKNLSNAVVRMDKKISTEFYAKKKEAEAKEAAEKKKKLDAQKKAEAEKKKQLELQKKAEEEKKKQLELQKKAELEKKKQLEKEEAKKKKQIDATKKKK